jgi:hypothetical protein
MSGRVDAALGYASMGTYVFPCNDLKEPHTKHGFHDASVDPDVIRGWWEKWPDAQIGVDCGRSKLAVVDLDVKDGQDGPGEWKKLTEGKTIPATFYVRTPSGGWHLWFRDPESKYRLSASQVAQGVDVRAGGGYVLAPASDGYTWYAEAPLSLDDIPAMPDGIIPTSNGGGTTGHWKKLDRGTLDPRDLAALEALESLGGHGAYLSDGHVTVTRPGKIAGASASIGFIGPGIVKVFTPNWPPLQEGAVYDADQLVAFVRPRADPTPDADADLWRRPELGHIRNFARARMAPPVVVLADILARVICRTPEWVTLPPLIFSPASLNAAIAIVGESGVGKSGAIRVAAEAVQMTGGCDFKTHSIGTGQGLAHAYARFDHKEGLVRTAYSAMLVLDEVAHLAGHARQNGSTILAELRRFLMGEPLGHLYVDLYKRVELPAHSYRGAVIIGVQPAKADALLDDSEGGTPQRFGWFPATDPTAGDDMPDCPPPLTWQAPAWDRRRAGPDRLLYLRVCDEAAAAIREAHRQRARGQGDPLDGHRLLTRERFAAGFALLAGHALAEGITADDWALAGTLLAISDRTRAQVVDRLARARAEQNRQRGEAEAERAAIIVERTADADLKRACRYITRKLSRAAGWVNGGLLRSSLPGPLRPLFDAAIDALLEAGQIEVEHVAGQGRPGVRYRRAEGVAA